MSIKIIGAGLPRTGTNTLKQSLEMLGYSKTYHMKELIVNPEMLPQWLALENGEQPNWDELYDGFEATVDFPAYPWYKEHMKRYPDAKVIMTVRPFEGWYKSIESTILTAGPQTPLEKIVMMIKLAFNPRLRKVIQCVKLAKRMIFQKHLQGKFADKAFAEEIFNKHMEDVKTYVPPEKLLIYDVRDGWGPLCEFLGKPVPEEELPHLNKRENFKSMLKDLMKGEMV
ncbi:MAG: hypothetical protein OER04_13590 [Cyclobacteriaceae bacterium]|nr:hypothetical protein [Cyclobacteriaceae bacterium]